MNMKANFMIIHLTRLKHMKSTWIHTLQKKI